MKEFRVGSGSEGGQGQKSFSTMPFPCLMPKYPSFRSGNGDLNYFLQDFYVVPKTDLDIPLPGISAILAGTVFQPENDAAYTPVLLTPIPMFHRNEQYSESSKPTVSLSPLLAQITIPSSSVASQTLPPSAFPSSSTPRNSIFTENRNSSPPSSFPTYPFHPGFSHVRPTTTQSANTASKFPSSLMQTQNGNSLQRPQVSGTLQTTTSLPVASQKLFSNDFRGASSQFRVNPTHLPSRTSSSTSSSESSRHQLHSSTESSPESKFIFAGIKRKKWTDEDMLRAIDLVHTKKMSARAAAAKCNVPRSTLWDRLSGRVTHGNDCRKKKKIDSGNLSS